MTKDAMTPREVKKALTRIDAKAESLTLSDILDIMGVAAKEYGSFDEKALKKAYGVFLASLDFDFSNFGKKVLNFK